MVILGLLEIAGLAGFIAFRDRACPILTAGQSSGGAAPGGTLALPAGAGLEGGSGGSTQTIAPQTPAPQASAPGASTAAAAGGDSTTTTGDVRVQGDANQVPDPNCVAKATAGLLNSQAAPSSPPSCAPMSPPPALKQAEQQVQAGASP